jgi:hypothetical protein
MEDINGYAEQCKNWSDDCSARSNGYAAHATTHDHQATAHPQLAGDPRLSDHAVHALWQTALPVCDWTRAWPQILSLSEQSGETSPPHLYTPGAGGADSGAIVTAPNLSHALRGAVRYRLRVAHATRRSVARTHVVGQPLCSGLSRCDGCQSTGGQHVGTRSERWALVRATTRGGTPCTRR